MSDKIVGRQRMELLSAQESVAYGLADKSVKIVWDSGSPSVDLEGGVIHLPPMPEEIPKDTFDIVRGYVDSKTGTLIHTDPSAGKGIKSAAEFVIAQSLEEGRTNRLMGEALHGCRVNMDLARNLVRDEFEARLTAMEAEGKAGQIGKAIIAIGQLSEGKTKTEALDFVRGDKEVGDLLDEVDKHLGDLTKLSSTVDAVSRAGQIYKVWKDYLVEPPTPPPSPGGGGEPPDDEDEDDDPEGGGGGGGAPPDPDDEESEDAETDGSGGGGSGDEEEDEEEDEDDEEEDGEDGEDGDSEEGEDEEGEDEEEDAVFAEDDDFDPSDEVREQDSDSTKHGKEKRKKFDADEEGRETKEGGAKTKGTWDAEEEGDQYEAPDAMSVSEAEELLRKAGEKAKEASMSEAMGGKIEVNMKGLHRKAGRPYLAFTENDEIIEVENTPSDMTASWYGDVRKGVAFLRTKLMMDLQGRGKRWRRFQDSGRVDPARLSRVGVGVGSIFRKKLIQSKIDTAMMMVVDLSGSMSGPRVKLALQLAMAFSEACELLDIPNEVVGFTTGYATGAAGSGIDLRGTFSRWEPLKHVIIKPFDKRFAQCKHSFVRAAEVGLSQNVDGEAVMWAARRLAVRREQDLRMIVLSDGFPAACECNQSEIRRHLKFAVKKAEKAGIQTVGIGIQSSAVSQYYDDNTVFHSLDDLVSGGYAKVSSYFKKRTVKAR